MPEVYQARITRCLPGRSSQKGQVSARRSLRSSASWSINTLSILGQPTAGTAESAKPDLSIESRRGCLRPGTNYHAFSGLQSRVGLRPVAYYGYVDECIRIRLPPISNIVTFRGLFRATTKSNAKPSPGHGICSSTTRGEHHAGLWLQYF